MSVKSLHYNLACISIIREKETKEPAYLMLDTDTKKVILFNKFEVKENIDKIFNLIDITDTMDDDILFRNQHPIKVFHIDKLESIKFKQVEASEDEIVKIKFDCDISCYHMNVMYRCAVEVVVDDELNGSNPVYNYLMTHTDGEYLTVEMLYCKYRDFTTHRDAKVNRIKVNKLDSINSEIDKINNKRTLLNLDEVKLQYVTSKITGQSVLYKMSAKNNEFDVLRIPKDIFATSYDLSYNLITDLVNPFKVIAKNCICISNKQYERLNRQIELVGNVYSSNGILSNGLKMLMKDNIILLK